jgi:hypothetical protein
MASAQKDTVSRSMHARQEIRQKKGIVESGVKFVKQGFLPLRKFRGLADADRQI